MENNTTNFYYLVKQPVGLNFYQEFVRPRPQLLSALTTKILCLYDTIPRTCHYSPLLWISIVPGGPDFLIFLIEQSKVIQSVNLQDWLFNDRGRTYSAGEHVLLYHEAKAKQILAALPEIVSSVLKRKFDTPKELVTTVATVPRVTQVNTPSTSTSLRFFPNEEKRIPGSTGPQYRQGNPTP